MPSRVHDTLSSGEDEAGSPVAPSELRLAKDRASLEIAWDDGSWSRFTAAFLRANSRSAEAKRVNIDDRGVAIPPDLGIVDLRLIGA